MASAEKAAQIERIIQKLKILGLVSTEDSQGTFPDLRAILRKGGSAPASIYLPEHQVPEDRKARASNQ